MKISNNYTYKPNFKGKFSSTTSSLTMSAVASTTASTAASTTASTAASTTASTAASTTASTTKSISKDKLPFIIAAVAATAIIIKKVFDYKEFSQAYKYNELDQTNFSDRQFKRFYVRQRKLDKNPALKNFFLQKTIGNNSPKPVNYEEITDSFKAAVKYSNIAENQAPTLEIHNKNEIFILKPDGTSEIKTVDASQQEAVCDHAKYDSDNHIIKYYAQNCQNPKEVLTHETYHVQQAILRNSIPEEDKADIVKEIILDGINKRTKSYIIKTYDGEDYTTMQTPNMSKKKAKKFCAFAQKYLFNSDTKLLEEMKEYEKLKYSNKDNNNPRLNELETELADVINALDTSGLNSKKYLEYAIATETRYHNFKKKDINLDIPVNKNYDREQVKKSISANIDASEGNIAYSLKRKATNENLNASHHKFKKLAGEEAAAYHQYLYNEEEFMARQTSYKVELDDLSAEMKKQPKTKNAETLSLEKDKKDVEFKMQNNQLNYEYYNINKNENNIIKKEISRFKLLDNQMRRKTGVGMILPLLLFGIYSLALLRRKNIFSQKITSINVKNINLGNNISSLKLDKFYTNFDKTIKSRYL